MKTRENILPVQVKKIHIAKKFLRLSEENYRSILAGFGVNSSKELTRKQAEELIGIFIKMGWKNKKSAHKKKYTEFDNRLGNRATGAQMRMLEAMWMDKAHHKSEAALNKFILRIVKKSHITMLLKEDVQKLKKAIEQLA